MSTTLASRSQAFTPEAYQTCLFAIDQPTVDPGFTGSERLWLDDATWVDVVPNWLHGADLVFADLVERLPWRQRKALAQAALPKALRICTSFLLSPVGTGG